MKFIFGHDEFDNIQDILGSIVSFCRNELANANPNLEYVVDAEGQKYKVVITATLIPELNEDTKNIQDVHAQSTTKTL